MIPSVPLAVSGLDKHDAAGMKFIIDGLAFLIPEATFA